MSGFDDSLSLGRRLWEANRVQQLLTVNGRCPQTVSFFRARYAGPARITRIIRQLSNTYRVLACCKKRLLKSRHRHTEAVRQIDLHFLFSFYKLR